MEAFRTLIHGDLPPAGNAIVTGPRDEPPEFTGYHTAWLDSGTSALALALMDARARRPDLTRPEVIVPAYCCPDLIAAADHAGITPRLVDIYADDPGLDIGHLAHALSANTLAVIAVNFLGIRERLGVIRTLLDGKAIALIEDNAQWFPQTNDLHKLAGDYVVFSFGRGKPVSLLGGGALLSRQPLDITAAKNVLPASQKNVVKTHLTWQLYNLLRHPQCYRLLNRNPLLSLGETRYHPLTAINTLDSLRLSLASANIAAYRKQSPATENTYDAWLAGINQLSPLLAGERRERLLRYPLLLAEADTRDWLLQRLGKLGLGVTSLYRKPVAELEGLDRLGNSSSLPSAQDFARRLLTLPVHSGVSTPQQQRIIKEIVSAAGSP